MAEVDPRFERDNRIFMGFLNRDLGPARVAYLAPLAVNKAAALPGPPDSISWFRGWWEVVKEVGTDADRDAVEHAVRNVKKLYDAGF